MTFFRHFLKFFTFCPQYWASPRPEEQNYGGNWALSVTIYIFGVLESNFFITGCPKKGWNWRWKIAFFPPKKAEFQPFFGHPVRKNLFSNTPKIKIVTLGVWFPPYFCSSGLSDAQYWGQKVTNFRKWRKKGQNLDHFWDTL